MSSITWGYGRVSTSGQESDRQRLAFLEAGIKPEHIFLETWSSMDMRRTQLAQLMAQVREGDVITITELSRASRSVKLLLEWVETLREKKVVLVSIAEGLRIDPVNPNPAATLILTVLSAVHEMMKTHQAELARQGRIAAMARGQRMGRKPLLDAGQQKALVRAFHAALREGDSATKAALDCGRAFGGVSPRTVFRVVAAAKAEAAA